jgi:hypothetical protein
VPSIEFLVLLSGIGVSMVISIWAHYKITQIASSQLAARVEELNVALGEAIQIVGSGVQTENPLMGIISKILEKQVEAPVTAKVIEQDAQGRFVKKNE